MPGILRRVLFWLAALLLLTRSAMPAEAQDRYHAHQAVLDSEGVIAPWYKGQNGQFDYRVRIAAETLKRYPWVDREAAISPAPAYIYNGKWSIDSSGKITVEPERDWENGDVAQRGAYLLEGMVDYYAYSGDPSAFAIVRATADYLVDHCETSPTHTWPNFLISVPTMGVPDGNCRLGPSEVLADGNGKMQLDLVAEAGLGLVRSYEMTGNEKWYQAAKHWADLLAARRRRDSDQSPWGRYADNNSKGMNGIQTGGAAVILTFFDELIRTGYRGKNGEIVTARGAARDYLSRVLLPAWSINDTWGRSYWDWEGPVQEENITVYTAKYLMQNKAEFPKAGSWASRPRPAGLSGQRAALARPPGPRSGPRRGSLPSQRTPGRTAGTSRRTRRPGRARDHRASRSS